MRDKDVDLACAEVIEKPHFSPPIMSTRRGAPRKARQHAHVTAGPLRNNHKTVLKKIWDERPCLPSVASRKAWARARGIDPVFVNKWFYARVQKVRESGFDLDVENEGYDLNVVDERGPTTTPPERGLIPSSTTPEGLPELSYYEHSTASETGLRIPLAPDQSSSPIFGSSFYSPKLILDSSSEACGPLTGIERFIFTPPSLPKRKSANWSLNPSRRSVEAPWTNVYRNASTPPASPTPSSGLPPLPLAPKKPRSSRGSHDILDFRIQDDPFLRFSPPTSSPTPSRAGYSLPRHTGPRVRERGDKPNVSTFADLRPIAVKTSRLTKGKQGRCINDDQRLSHIDDQTTLSRKFLLTIKISVLRTITTKVCPFQLSVSTGPLSKHA